MSYGADDKEGGEGKDQTLKIGIYNKGFTLLELSISDFHRLFDAYGVFSVFYPSGKRVKLKSEAMIISVCSEIS